MTAPILKRYSVTLTVHVEVEAYDEDEAYDEAEADILSGSVDFDNCVCLGPA